MISIIIPYVEDRGWLDEAISSLRSQTFHPIESRRECSPATQGVNANWGIYRTEAEFIKVLHDDDILPPNSIKDLLDGIQGFDFVCGDQRTFGDPIYCPDPKVYKGCIPTFREMLNENQIYGGTTLYRKDVLQAVGGYDETLHTGEEYDLHLRLLKAGYRCNYIPKVTHHYRLHERNKSYYLGPGEKKERREFIREIAKRHERTI